MVSWVMTLCSNYAGNRLPELEADVLPAPLLLICPHVSLDITSSEFVSQILGDIRPDVVIHCAAWTAVDAAELTENREIVRRVNEDGTKIWRSVARHWTAK